MFSPQVIYLHPDVSCIITCKIVITLYVLHRHIDFISRHVCEYTILEKCCLSCHYLCFYNTTFHYCFLLSMKYEPFRWSMKSNLIPPLTPGTKRYEILPLIRKPRSFCMHWVLQSFFCDAQCPAPKVRFSHLDWELLQYYKICKLINHEHEPWSISFFLFRISPLFFWFIFLMVCSISLFKRGTPDSTINTKDTQTLGQKLLWPGTHFIMIPSSSTWLFELAPPAKDSTEPLKLDDAIDDSLVVALSPPGVVWRGASGGLEDAEERGVLCMQLYVYSLD